MHPVLILAIAVSIVLLGILLLRLHAFVALLLAALSVALLTPREEIERAEIKNRRVKILQISDDQNRVTLDFSSKQGAVVGQELVVLRFGERGEQPREVGRLEITSMETDESTSSERSVAVWTPNEPQEKIQSDDFVIVPTELVAARKAAATIAPLRVTAGFGRTCAGIGVLIAMASIIGKCLLDSGAADKIVRFTLRLLGQPRAPFAFLGSGFLLGIPVFFDTVFYLMMPLGKAMRLRTGRNYLLYILTIVAGATMAHSLVPPTPGPLLVADELGVNLLTMIIGGTVVGIFAAMAGFLWALAANRMWNIPLRESTDVSLQELQTLADRDERELPPLWLAVAPILLPVILIAAATALRSYLDATDPSEVLGALAASKTIVYTLGNPNLALMLAAAIALGMLAWKKRASRAELAEAMQTALAGGGVIILITAGGGAFGATVRQCGIAEEIANLTKGVNPVWILPIAFLVTTLVRSAQGSATVAMITAVSILSGVVDQLHCHTVYLALAIGCGSKPIAWMADSGFWVICKMSGMTEAEGLKTITPMSIVMGLAGLAAVMVLAWAFPLTG